MGSKQDDTTFSEDESSRLYNLANSTLAECIEAAPLSDLNTAIDLFREALDRRAAGHPPRSDVLKRLARALGTRFSLTSQLQDLDQALLLHWSVVFDETGVVSVGTGGQFQVNRNHSAECDNMLAVDQDNSEVSKLNELAKAALANFNQSTQLSSLDAAVCLHREALRLRRNQHPERIASLGSLAAALYARFRCTDDVLNIDEAISLLNEAVGAYPEAYTYLTDHLCNLSIFLATRFDMNCKREDLQESMARRRYVSQFTIGINLLLKLGNDFSKRFSQSRDNADVETAIAFFREGLEMLSLRHPYRSVALNSLANALHTRFDQSGQFEDLNEAISLHRDVLHLLPVTHPDRSDTLNDLAVVLVARFNQLGQCEDLNDAIALHRDALKLVPASYPHRSGYLNNLAAALGTRFNNSAQRKDLDEAISLHRDALELQPAPHPDRSMSLNNLALTLQTRFSQLGQRKDLDESISLHRDALQMFPSPHPYRSSSLIGLAGALHDRFSQSGQHEELDEAISLHQEAIKLRPAPHPERSHSLVGLAKALSTRSDQLGRRNDLDDAILLYRDALQLSSATHPIQSSALRGLAIALCQRFDKSGHSEDLDDAISLHRNALELLPAPHPDRQISMSNLAVTLITRFHQSGQRDDLDDAISLHRNALEFFPVPNPYRHSSLTNLGNALSQRFDQSGQGEDLDEAILLQQDALQLEPAPHPSRSGSMNNLATLLSKRFEQSGQHKDLENAISLHRDVLELFPAPHPRRPLFLNNLAAALNTRVNQLGQFEDLDEAISLYRDALELLPLQDRSWTLNNLAIALSRRFNQEGQHEDLDEAISFFHASLNALASGHHYICSISANLGDALMDAFSRTHEPEHLEKAMTAYRVGVTCESAPASERFDAARVWAHHADSRHESALEAYCAAIELLPRLAMLGLDLQSRHQALISGSDGLARGAAACAVRSGQYEMAVELLEAGRAVFWSQALQLRTPMTDLHEVAPELVTKLRRISMELERGSFRDVPRRLSEAPQKVMSMEREVSHFRRQNEEWLTTLEEVRQLDGFQNFLRPSRISMLQHGAANGPVVVLNASNTGCTALILTATGVQHVPFPDLSFVAVTALVKLLRHAVAQGGRNPPLPKSNGAHVDGLVQQIPFVIDASQLLRPPSERHIGRASDRSEQPEEVFRYVLGVLWKSVVEPVIRRLDLKKSDDPTRLWWCPTGPFTFLPIHAAGMYATTSFTECTECTFDYIVSSYTPSISTLLGDISLPAHSFKMMVAIQPDTPGQRSLPFTLDELRKIEDHVGNNDYLIKIVRGSVKEVLSHLPAASIAHFSCHGQQNTQSPLESALLLQDGPLKVSHIMQQSMPNASLAFLSACETAMGAENLPDEVIHLGAALLFVGFRGVIATMWSMTDLDGPKIADTFYENLFKESGSTTTTSGPNTTQAACALHRAITRLRSENISFLRWVPFIHLGR